MIGLVPWEEEPLELSLPPCLSVSNSVSVSVSALSTTAHQEKPCEEITQTREVPHQVLLHAGTRNLNFPPPEL